MLDTTLFVLKIALLVLLYLFIWHVVRSAGRDLRAGVRVASGQSEAAAPPAPPSYASPPEAEPEWLPADAGGRLPSASAGPRLVVEHSGLLRAGAELALDDGLTVGRAPENDLVLDDPFVSTLHARLERRGAVVTVEDLGSTNGTFVNERPVQREDLTPGARLRIGETVFRYEA